MSVTSSHRSLQSNWDIPQGPSCMLIVTVFSVSSSSRCGCGERGRQGMQRESQNRKNDHWVILTVLVVQVSVLTTTITFQNPRNPKIHTFPKPCLLSCVNDWELNHHHYPAHPFKFTNSKRQELFRTPFYDRPKFDPLVLSVFPSTFCQCGDVISPNYSKAMQSQI
jgi:hypothetical protein